MKKVVISVFRNAREVNNPKPVYLYSWLTKRPGNEVLSLIEAIRSEDDKNQILAYKDKLPVCTPSGVFRTRNDDGLLLFSGYMQLDVDNSRNPDLDPEEAKELLIELPYIGFAGLSASGKGVWALAKIPAPDDWKERYNAIEADVFNKTGIVLDPCTDTISQPRFYSLDNSPCINEEAVNIDNKLHYSTLNHKPKSRSGRRGRYIPFLEVPKHLLSDVVEFNKNHSARDVLEGFQWIYTTEANRRNRSKYLVYYTRPGKENDPTALIRKSGSIVENMNTFFCHSTNSVLPAKEHLTPFDLICYVMFKGNVQEAINYCRMAV